MATKLDGPGGFEYWRGCHCSKMLGGLALGVAAIRWAGCVSTCGLSVLYQAAPNTSMSRRLSVSPAQLRGSSALTSIGQVRQGDVETTGDRHSIAAPAIELPIGATNEISVRCIESDHDIQARATQRWHQPRYTSLAAIPLSSDAHSLRL